MVAFARVVRDSWASPRNWAILGLRQSPLSSFSGGQPLPTARFVGWLSLGASKYREWKRREGRINEHNGKVPRDHWLTAEEVKAIEEFARERPFEGYRRIRYVLMDADVVAASPSFVYRVMGWARLLGRWYAKPSSKGTASRTHSSRTKAGTSTSRA